MNSVQQGRAPFSERGNVRWRELNSTEESA